jgi:hypothetical protein
MNLSFTGTGDFRQAKDEVSAFGAAVNAQMAGVAQSFAQATGASGAFVNALGPVGFGLTALAGAAIAAGGAVFGLAEKTADTEVKLWDMSQRVNFSVETLSGLKIAIENSGGSFDKFEAGLIFFQKNIEAAAEGNKKLSAAFKALNIDTSSNEAALRSAFTQLSKITDGTQQAALAQKLFRGSGREVLGIIKESHGDFDAYIAKLQKLGIVIGTEAAANADKFRDALHVLTLEGEAAGREIGDEVLPALTGAMQDFTTATANSKSVFKEWGEGLRDALQIIRTIIETMRQSDTWDTPADTARKFSAAADKIQREDQISSGMLIPLDQSEMTPEQKQAAQDRSEREIRRAFAAAGMRFPETSIDPSLLAGGKSGSADKARNEAVRKLEEQNKQIEEEYRRNAAELQRDYDLQLTSSQTFTKKLIDEANDRYNKLKANLDKEAALYKPGTSGAEKVAAEQQKALDERDKTIQQAQDAQNKREIDALKKHRDALLALGEQYDQQTIDSIRATADMGGLTYEDAEDKIYDIQEKAFDRRLQALRDDEAAFYATQKDINDVNLEQALQYSDGIDALVAQQEAHQAEHERRRNEARQRDIEAERQYQQQIKQIRLQAVNDDLAIRRMEVEAAQAEAFNPALHSRRPTFAEQRSLNKSLADADREIENERHKEVMKALDDQEAEARRQAILHHEIFTEEETYHRLRENELRKHQLKMGEIQRGQDKADADANPLKGAWDQLKEQTKFTDFLQQQAADGLLQMKDAFGQAIEANILYGESIGKALEKALAAYLAHVSAESTIEALRQAAWALACLAFGDFAGAAKHGVAAAAFGALALATGAAGSSLAKSAGMRDTGASASSGSTAGQAMASTAPPPNNQNFLFNTSGTSSSADFRAGIGTSGVGLMNAEVFDRLERIHQQQMTLGRYMVTAVAENTKALSTFKTARLGDMMVKEFDTPRVREKVGSTVLDHSSADDSFNDRLARNLRVS